MSRTKMRPIFSKDVVKVCPKNTLPSHIITTVVDKLAHNAVLFNAVIAKDFEQTNELRKERFEHYKNLYGDDFTPDRYPHIWERVRPLTPEEHRVNMHIMDTKIALRAVMDKVQPVLRDEKGTKWITHLERAIKAQFRVNLPTSLKEDISNFISQWAAKGEFVIDFADEITWGAYDFGQKGSCWWNDCRPGWADDDDYDVDTIQPAYEWMRLGGFAVRWYTESNTPTDDPIYTPAGRAWMYEIADNTYCVFNAYGLHDYEFANIVATFLNNVSVTSGNNLPTEYTSYKVRSFGIDYYDDAYDGCFYENTSSCFVVAPRDNPHVVEFFICLGEGADVRYE